jgi:hypothetical protein
MITKLYSKNRYILPIERIKLVLLYYAPPIKKSGSNPHFDEL